MPQIYELTIYKARTEIVTILAGVDFHPDLADHTSDLLTRHLHAAALRHDDNAREQYLFHLEARDVDQQGKGSGPVRFRWALPTEKEER